MSPKETPMMKQYREIKDKAPDTLLLYRMGDFYELFENDAKIASKILGLTLTSRNHGGKDKTPLAGFPHHALDRYAHRLVKAGHKIAVCEQVEDPKKAKGIVKRDIIEVITSGTATGENFIDDKSNNFIVALFEDGSRVGMAVCDISTGEFYTQEIDHDKIIEEITRIDPSEVHLSFENTKVESLIKETFPSIYVSKSEPWKFDYDLSVDILKKQFSVESVEGLGLEKYRLGTIVSGALISYLKDQKRSELKHISHISLRENSKFAELDPSTIRNLELLKPMQTEDTGGTLISVIDKTDTTMGARLLKRWVTRPLKSIPEIEERLDAVEWLKKDLFIRSELQILLKRIFDVERLIAKITFEKANARDLVALKKSLDIFPDVMSKISDSDVDIIRIISSKLSGFEPVSEKIDSTIVDEPPLSIREGNIINRGINPELDELKDALVNGKNWIAKLQQSEKEKTGINNIKVGYNKVFGYYLEVSKANADLVPETYIRKQTLTNAERFITPELKDMEAKILGADEKLSAIEYDIFVALRNEIALDCERIQRAADAIATLDVILTFAKIAADNRYVRPQLNNSRNLFVEDGRHPVVEAMNSTDEFIPNDTNIQEGESQILLITGPNMAGKSTYLRQNALISIMAQMGSFVPAKKAELGIVDKFFTRVGASDRLARGQSTFLVEMIEVANILNNATDNSLVLLDEVGRGTSTFDGISIAWAVAEALHEEAGRRPRTFFATHYHELTELELLFKGIKNLHIKVKEWNDKIIFLRKIGEGGCDHSYGIQVARLAGIPTKVIVRAKELLSNLENMELTPDHKPVLARSRNESYNAAQTNLFEPVQMNFIDSAKVELIQQLQTTDVNNLTPIEALNLLQQLKVKAEDLL